LNIVVAFDDEFARHASAMLASCFRHNVVHRVFAIVDGLTITTARRVAAQVQKQGARCHLLEVSAAGFTGFPVFGHVSKMTYARLFALDLLPAGLERALYLDADTVIVGSLVDFWNMKLEGAPAACVEDRNVTHKGLLGMSEASRYFNAGVMLWDIPAMRHRAVMERARAFIRDNPERVLFWDQDALNVALEGSWREVPARWNTRFRPGEDGWRSNLANGEKATVVHFDGSGLKPWQTGSVGHPYRHFYTRARWQSAWPKYLDPAWVQTPKNIAIRTLRGVRRQGRQILARLALKRRNG
jgi:lipopolysaccharide biosynthesis glycosyltransferase